MKAKIISFVILCACLVSFTGIIKEPTIKVDADIKHSELQGFWIGQKRISKIGVCNISEKESDIKPVLIKMNLKDPNSFTAIEYYYNSIYNKYKITAKWESEISVNDTFSFDKISYSYCNNTRTKNTDLYNGEIQKEKDNFTISVISNQQWCPYANCEFQVEYTLSKITLEEGLKQL